MKELDELNNRMGSNEEIVDNLVKKYTQLEKLVAGLADMKIPDHSEILKEIIQEIKSIKKELQTDQQGALLNTISTKMDKIAKSPMKQLRILLFPETNQGQYYTIVFGRLIPWGLCFMTITYVFITGYKAINVYNTSQKVRLADHYERAWFYMRDHSKKKTVEAMDEAFRFTDKK